MMKHKTENKNAVRDKRFVTLQKERTCELDPFIQEQNNKTEMTKKNVNTFSCLI